MKNVKNNIQKRNRRNLQFHHKGIIDVQFNWIFVMIAGFVMFLFIISIVFAQKRSADTQAGISAANQINTLIKGKQQTANVYSEITIPLEKVNFQCDAAYDTFTFKIENAQPTPLQTEIIFAPQNLATNKIIIWSQAFTVGFPVSVFTYISTDKSMILIYNDSESTYASQIYADLPNNISRRQISDPTEISAYNSYDHVKIICFEGSGCPPANYEYMRIIPGSSTTGGVTAPISNMQVGLYDYGTVIFHKKGSTLPDSALQTTYYITESGLYGAIFSDNVGFYNCQMSRALKQFEVKRSLVESRLLLLQNVLEPDSECRVATNTTLELEIKDMRNPVLNADNVSSLYINSKYLDARNTDLQLSSCPQIY